MKQIAVQACGAEEAGAHRVGKLDESNSGEIKCMALVRMIYGDSGWDKKMSYRLLGRAFPQQRLVSFKICIYTPTYKPVPLFCPKHPK